MKKLTSFICLLSSFLILSAPATVQADEKPKYEEWKVSISNDDATPLRFWRSKHYKKRQKFTLTFDRGTGPIPGTVEVVFIDGHTGDDVGNKYKILRTENGKKVEGEGYGVVVGANWAADERGPIEFILKNRVSQ